MTHKPHTPPQPDIEAVGEKPDFELMARLFLRKLNDDERYETRELLAEEALQSAFEAGVAQGRKGEREYIAGAYEKRGVTYFQKETYKELGKEIRSLAPQGDQS